MIVHPKIGLIKTGIKDLDDVIGGFYEGQIILVEGTPGTGKTLFVARLAYEALRRGENVTWISTIERLNEFMEFMGSIGLDLRKYVAKELFEFIELMSISREEAGANLANIVIDSIKTYNAKLIILDTIDPFISALSPLELFTIVRSLIKDAILKSGSLFIVIHELRKRDEDDQYMLRAWADAVLRFNLEVPGMGAPRRFLEILKIRGRPIGRVVYEVDIFPDKGIEIYPAGVLEIPESKISIEEKLPTYVEGLDEILNGGFIKGTSVLITGPTGSGKTILTLFMAANWALNGYRVYFISFEEPYQQVVETLRFLRFNVDELVGRKLIIKSINPRTITITSFFNVVIRDLVIDKNTVVVIDGLHSIRKEFGEVFHRHVRDLVVYCKKHGATIILSMICIETIGRKAITWLSTIVDGIIELIMRREDLLLKRYVLIRKMRMAEVEPKLYEFKLVDRRIKVIV